MEKLGLFFEVLGHHSSTTIQKVFEIVLDENAGKHSLHRLLERLAPNVNRNLLYSCIFVYIR